jgi:hypothetical protein
MLTLIHVERFEKMTESPYILQVFGETKVCIAYYPSSPTTPYGLVISKLFNVTLPPRLFVA